MDKGGTYEPVQATDEERVLGLLDKAMERREARIMDKVTGQLEQLAQPREENRIPVTDEQEGGEVDARAMTRPAGQVQTRVATHPLYRQFEGTPHQEWRSPESDHYVQAWLRALATRDWGALERAQDEIDRIYGRAPGDPWDVGGVNAAGSGYDGDGGPLVPLPLVQIIMINRDTVAKVPGLSTPITLNQMSNRVPRLDTAQVIMVAEGSIAPEVTPTLTELNFTARKMQGHAEVTLECLADSAFNTVGLLGQRMGMAMGQLEDVQACTSNGTSPNITGNIRTGLTYTSIGAGGLTYAAVVALYFGVAQQYRMDGVWYGNGIGLAALTSVVAAGGYPIFSTQNARPGAIVDDGADGFVFGKPVYEVPIVGDTTTNGQGALIFMSRSSYGWARRQGMAARASEHSAWARDSVAYKFTQRVDGQLLDPGGGNGASRAGADDFA